ncbi:MAG: flagellar hook-associated protein FlgL [Immundisolibacter sp.]|uniref:flagellar hook-associated protein FlgL n=1 Tax=Immundisolibacter sp. TaxID=1934948 RepID=UPI003EE0BF3A
MRVSTSNFYILSLASMQARQADLDRVQRQLGSGLKLLQPADNPGAAASINRFQATLAATDAFTANINRANAALGAEESALSSVGDVLNRVRELTLQGLNAGQSAESRRGIAVEVRAMRSQLMALANSVGSDGEYLFAGYKVTTPPYQETAGVVSYVGDAGQRTLELSPGNNVVVADAGSAVFGSAREGNGVFRTVAGLANTGSLVVGGTAVVGAFIPDTYTASFTVGVDGVVSYSVTGAVSGPVASGTYADGDALSFAGVTLNLSGLPATGDVLRVTPAARQDAFAALEELAAALELPDGAPAQRAAQVNRLSRGLESLDQQLLHISAVRASVGARLQVGELVADAHAGAKLRTQEALSDVSDLDYAEAATRLAQQLTSLQAVQETFSRLASLSLFNYLR